MTKPPPPSAGSNFSKREIVLFVVVMILATALTVLGDVLRPEDFRTRQSERSGHESGRPFPVAGTGADSEMN
jgi:hypothetical protein